MLPNDPSSRRPAHDDRDRAPDWNPYDDHPYERRSGFHLDPLTGRIGYTFSGEESGTSRLFGWVFKLIVGAVMLGLGLNFLRLFFFVSNL